MTSEMGQVPSNYTDAVTEARTLIKRSEDDQWRLAKLTWEKSQPQRGREILPEGKVSVAQWARDIGVDDEYARRLRLAWERFGSDPLRPKFSDAYNEISRGGLTSSEKAKAQALADPEAVRQAATENPEIFNALVQDELFRGRFLEAVTHILREEGEFGNALRKTRSEEWTATLWMSKMAVHLAEAHNYSPEDIFVKARPGDIDSWDRTLQDGIPFLVRIQHLIRERQSGKLELVR